MWCTTECWNCEDKNCKHYFSKQDIYFEYKKLQSNWNSLKQILIKEDYIEIVDKMNELEGKKNDK